MKSRRDGPQLVPVHYEFTHATAVTIGLAGMFNQWQPAPVPIVKPSASTARPLPSK